MCKDLKQNKTTRKPNSHLRIPRCRTRYSDNDNEGRAVWGWPLQLWYFPVRGHGWGVRLTVVALHGWAENAGGSWPAQGHLQLLKYSWGRRVCRGGSSSKSQNGCEWMLRKLTGMVVARGGGSQKVWNLWRERVNHLKSIHGDVRRNPCGRKQRHWAAWKTELVLSAEWLPIDLMPWIGCQMKQLLIFFYY